MQAERDRDRHDAEFAAEIQLELLPDDDLEVPGFELDWAYVPSKHVGGDFYDCTVVDENHIVLVIGDVSGKSIGAALFMARLMSFLRATIPEDPSPGSVLTRTNALLGTRASRTMFSTAFYMLVSRSQGTIRYASAGHNPVLLLTPEADACVEEAATVVGTLLVGLATECIRTFAGATSDDGLIGLAVSSGWLRMPEGRAARRAALAPCMRARIGHDELRATRFELSCFERRATTT